MRLPSGAVRCFDLPFDVRSGSRGVGDPSTPDSIFLLDNGSSRLWRVRVGPETVAEELTAPGEASRFRASLGSRLVVCGQRLLVTGTPGPGAHTPWLFDQAAGAWSRLPDAPHPILSSAVVAADDGVTIAGGWSKQRSCHGHVQALRLAPPFSWTVLPGPPLPWRRPGAGCCVRGELLVALGWMESVGRVGDPNFRLLRRNGGAQGESTSSSRLCSLGPGGSRPASELSALPTADSFEHNGELYAMGDHIVCIGRDRLQAFNLPKGTWQTWPLPRELGNDSSSSWVKHCGSWTLAWLAA